MPGPFKRKSNQKVDLTPAAVVLRPALAIGIANISSHWAKLEQTLGLAFTVLLLGREPAAFESYHGLFDLSLRHQMFCAAARGKNLPNELIQEAEGIHKLVRKVAKSRNTVVHGTWAVCDDLPESLLLCNPKLIDAKVDEFWRKFYEKVYDQDAIAKGWSFELMVDDFTEYRHDDFTEITKRIISVEARAQAHWQKVQQYVLGAELARRPPLKPQ